MKVLQTLLALLAGLGSVCWAPTAISGDTSSISSSFVTYHFPNVPSLGTLETRRGNLDRDGLGPYWYRRHLVGGSYWYGKNFYGRK